MEEFGLVMLFGIAFVVSLWAAKVTAKIETRSGEKGKGE